MEHHSQPDSPQKEAGKPDNKLHLTAVSSLLVWAAVAAFCAWLMVSTFYSNLADFTVWVSIPVMLLAIVDGALAIYIRRAIDRNRGGPGPPPTPPGAGCPGICIGTVVCICRCDLFRRGRRFRYLRVAAGPYFGGGAGRFARCHRVHSGRFPAGGSRVGAGEGLPGPTR